LLGCVLSLHSAAAVPSRHAGYQQPHRSSSSSIQPLAAGGKGFADKAVFDVEQPKPDPSLWEKEYKVKDADNALYRLDLLCANSHACNLDPIESSVPWCILQ
jgi:hypothetical protein